MKTKAQVKPAARMANRAGFTFSTKPVAQPRSNTSEQTVSEPALYNTPQVGHAFGTFDIHHAAMPMIQPKLKVGPVNDHYEQEADRVAQQVVGQINQPAMQRQEMPEEEEQLQTKPLADSIQRQEMPEEEELQTKPELQRQADGSMAAPPAVESAIHQARGSGQPLADNTRQPMERAFGADFSHVKVHTDAQADQLNRSIQARAFTTGQDIFFRQGEHSPGTQAGQALLAHELTHVVQQNGNTVQRQEMQNTISKSYRTSEAEKIAQQPSENGGGQALLPDSFCSTTHLIQRRNTVTGVKRPIAESIYKNHLKGDFPFKPQKGKFGAVSWFSGNKETGNGPYVGGQAQSYDITIDVRTSKEPTQIDRDRFSQVLAAYQKEHPKFDPKRDKTYHNEVWRLLGQGLEKEQLAEVYVPEGPLSLQGSGTFITANAMGRNLIRLSNPEKLQADLGATAKEIASKIDTREKKASTKFDISFSPATLDEIKGVQQYLAEQKAKTVTVVSKELGPDMVRADLISAGRNQSATFSMEYENYRAARIAAKTLATMIDIGFIKSKYFTSYSNVNIKLRPGTDWGRGATKGYTK